jgi:hypothetical protein
MSKWKIQRHLADEEQCHSGDCNTSERDRNLSFGKSIPYSLLVRRDDDSTFVLSSHKDG